MTKYQILMSIYWYLEQKYQEDKNKTEEYIFYISNVTPFIWKDKSTADPAYYSEFLEICDTFFKEDNCTIEDGLFYANKYLDKLNEIEHLKYNSNIDEVIEIFKKCDLNIWKEIFEEVKAKLPETN